jgi:hypothetical protein
MRALAIALALCTAGCTGLNAGPPDQAPRPFDVRPTDTPYVLVTAGPVSGLVPGRWEAAPLDAGARFGFVASPRPDRFAGEGPAATGLSAAWIDASQVGVPSDYYYLAASGPGLGLVSHPTCEARRTIFADHSPAYLAGDPDSPGDFLARTDGTCDVGGGRRWTSFIAAPGFGPMRELGIPASGLYVVTAVTRDTPGARGRLLHLLRGIRFGETRIGDFVRVATTI